MQAWILALMLLLAPARVAELPTYPGWAEAPSARVERYIGIADAIAAATSDPWEAALLVAVSYHESAWAPDVDAGQCYRGPRGTGPRCDAGRAVTVWQLHASGERARALVADRRLAAREALEQLRRSRRACAPLYGAELALGTYAAGDCSRGAQASREMIAIAQRLVAQLPFRPE
jgi:hypothetical protein